LPLEDVERGIVEEAEMERGVLPDEESSDDV
jgi:hypothetical protein